MCLDKGDTRNQLAIFFGFDKPIMGKSGLIALALIAMSPLIPIS